jgi:hypothetical protein
MILTTLRNTSSNVIPLMPGIHLLSSVSDEVDPGFRRGDENKNQGRRI